MLWTEEHCCEKNTLKLRKCLGISEFLAKLLISRGIESHLEAEYFLKPKLALLEDPYDIPNLKCATIRICDAIEKNENILIVGDYDVDGISSTVIIFKVLSAFGIEAKYVIPHRQAEGYGLTKEVLQRGMEQNEFSLVLALDCGTNSRKEADFLQNKNIDLIVVDHHKAKGEIHEHSNIINPHLQETDNQWSNLCTAGLCFKLVHGIIKFLREAKHKTAFEISPKDFLPLAAIGTLADMVPLRGENRILAKYGLKHLRNNPEVGLRSLLKLANLDTQFPFDSEDITFRIAPRINACGRLDRPEIAAELLLTKNSEEASKLASITNEFNEERKLIETKLTEKALGLAETKFSSRKAAVITGQGSEWNPGVVGIVAGKLANTLHKPCLVLAFENGKYKGSGRGFKGTNLVDALSSCEELLEHWGGHPAAVGLSVDESKVKLFEEAFLTYIEGKASVVDNEPCIKIDSTLSLNEINDDLLNVINKLGPFGQDNPEPVFALKKIELRSNPKKVGNGAHFQFKIENSRESISGIAWNMSDRMPPTYQKLDLAFKLRWNRWNNHQTPQISLIDWRINESI